jgi:phosphate transport system substrate-binding protein
MTATIEGIAQIGMASRELKDNELAELDAIVIAMDGIAVIVNNSNPLNGASSEQINAIFTGQVTKWSEIK